ncbi:MAG: hypothetical protein MH252_17860 [Thermosynechococcaceae cyanobacterium MS004]|nr:hypothetical protein [Thermosynechococcaceae cyanobacterium MS004]
MPKPNNSRPQSGQDLPPVDDASPANLEQEVVEIVAAEGSAQSPASTITLSSGRQQPISPPSEPMQFRAIGLVQGKYQPSKDRFNRGTLTVEDGTQIDAVLLGQVMSLVRNYIKLERSYFWVVYPRTREKEQTLHLQVVGVWSEDGFTPITGAEDAPAAEDSAEKNTASQADGQNLDSAKVAPDEAGSDEVASDEVVLDGSTSDGLIEDGYFSVRGQVVYQAQDKELLYVKIQQTSRSGSKKAKGSKAQGKDRGDRDKSFKLKILGTLPQKAIGYFWDLHVKRQGNDLVLQNGTSIALMPVQKNKRPQGRPSRPFSKVPVPNSARPNRAYRPPEPKPRPDRESRPVPKPIKRQSNSSNPSE